MERTGRCACGGVVYRSEGPWRDIIACHCVECRRTSGHVWAATAVPAECLTLDRDERLVWYRSSDVAQRAFCSGCGASLFYRHDTKSYIAVAAGTLDDDSGLTCVEEVFVEEKGSYYSLTDGIPHHVGFSGNWKQQDRLDE